jgi:alanine dehydrogenase
VFESGAGIGSGFADADSVKTLVSEGNSVAVETGAGIGSGFADADYSAAGASICETAREIFDISELIIKVKEPQKQEVELLRKNQLLFTYLHLAANKELTLGLMKSGSTCIAYETVTDENNRLPLLAPMSEVAGRISIQAGARSLEMTNNGRGVLLSGATGAPPANVVIIGCGVVGFNAALIAHGMKANVILIDQSQQRLDELKSFFNDEVTTVISTPDNIDANVKNCDLLIGGVLVPGASAPKLVSESLVSKMKPGAALVDVAIDQGGCIETSKPTTHADPVYVLHNVVHYCVTNMPGAVPLTATEALNKVSLSYVRNLADNGIQNTLDSDEHLRNGLNILDGRIVHPAVKEALE